MVAAKIKPRFEAEAKGRQGERTDLSADLRKSDPFDSSERAADLVNVSTRLVESASKVQRNGTPDLVHAVERGEIRVSAAAVDGPPPLPYDPPMLESRWCRKCEGWWSNPWDCSRCRVREWDREDRGE